MPSPTIQPHVFIPPTMLHSQLEPETSLQGGRYVVEKMLGKGGMGHVYLARDTHFSGPKALRALKELIPRPDDLQARMGSFTREANVLVALRHPAIPTVYDSFAELGRAYVVLDYIPGHDLDQVLRRSADMLPVEDVGTWMIQLCDVVQYLHSQHPPVIFRDLKPSNVILTPERHIVLIDFGIAKVFSDDQSQTNVGTNGYAAPEQYEGRAGTCSDIYSLGAMMHHLLTRTDPRRYPPFTFAERPIHDLNPQVSPELATVIMHCLERDPARRFQTVGELRTALQDALRLGDEAASRPLTPYRITGSLSTNWNHENSSAEAMPGAPAIRWRFRTQDEVRATPAVKNGLLVVGSYDKRLYALDASTGEHRWQFTAEGGICGRPAFWEDLILFGAEDFQVYALNALTGREVWRNRTWNHVRSSPRVYDDTLYIGSDDGHMQAIDPRTGHVLWRYRTYREVQSSAAYSEGTVFFGSSDEYLYAVEAQTGTRRWAYHTQGAVLSSPVVIEDRVYFGSMDFSVYCLDAKSGWLVWSERTDRFVVSSPCVAGDRLYIGSTDGHLYCLNRRTGRRLWRYPTGFQVNSTPVFYSGAVYFGCIDGAVYCVDGSSGKLIWRLQTDGKVPGSVCYAGGLVHVGSTDGWVYAIEAHF